MSEKYVGEVFPELPDHLPFIQYLKGLKLDVSNESVTIGKYTLGFFRNGSITKIVLSWDSIGDFVAVSYIFAQYEDGFEIYTQESSIELPDEIRRVLPANGCYNCKKLYVRTSAPNFVCPFEHITCKKCRYKLLSFEKIKDNDCVECIRHGNNVLQ